MRLIAPCKDCPDRVPEPNCHITCEKYLTFKRLKEEQKSEQVKIAKMEQIQNDIERDRIRKASTGSFYRSKYKSKKGRKK